MSHKACICYPVQIIWRVSVIIHRHLGNRFLFLRPNQTLETPSFAKIRQVWVFVQPYKSFLKISFNLRMCSHMHTYAFVYVVAHICTASVQACAFCQSIHTLSSFSLAPFILLFPSLARNHAVERNGPGVKSASVPFSWWVTESPPPHPHSL